MATPVSAAPRGGITLTQQIFIGLAIGIVLGWIIRRAADGDVL